MWTNKQKIKFILLFSGIYVLLLLIFLETNTLFSNYLLLFEKNFVYLINPLLLHTQLFVLVPECTGIVSISVYLAAILALVGIGRNTRVLIVIRNIFIIFFANLLRIIIILWVGVYNIALAKILHVIIWFVLGALVFWLIYINEKKRRII